MWDKGRQHGTGTYTNSKGIARMGEWDEGEQVKHM